MNISYDAYRTFYCTAKYRSFTKAAAALGSSQPNVTRAIKNLEQALGCTLFLRDNRRVELTPEGEMLYRYASVAFEQLRAGEEAVVQGAGLEGGVLRIAATEVALRAFLLPVLARFRREHPGVRLQLFNGATAAAIAEVENGLADLAFVTTPADNGARLRKTPLLEVQDVAVCGRAYAALAGRALTLAELAAQPIISLGAESCTNRFYARLFAAHGLTFVPDIEAATSDQILPLVRAELGIGFVPAPFLAEAGAEVLRLRLAEPLPPRQVCMVEAPRRPIGAAAKVLKRLCLETARSRIECTE